MPDATPPASAPILPGLFISSVSDEFRSLRLQVEETVRHLGYHPITMDHWPTGHGELRAWLRQQIDQSEGLIHIPGIAYGAEPTDHDPAAHGLPADTPRYSYTQYEFLYARQQGKKTWVITPGDHCTRDTAPDLLDLPKNPDTRKPDPTLPGARQRQTELRALQTAYLQRLEKDNHLRYRPEDDKDLRLLIHTLRDHAQELRENFAHWQTFVTGYMQQMEKRTRQLRTLALGSLALLIIVITVVWWVKQDTAPLAQGQQTVIQGQGDLAAQLSQVQEALSRIQQNTDPAKDPISQWPQSRLEDELARQMQMSVTDLRAILLAGRTSLDALLQGQSLLASGKPKEAGAKFDEVLQQEASAVQRVKQAYEGKAQIAYDLGRYEEALDYRQKAAALVDKTTAPLAWAAAQNEVAFILHLLARHQEAEPIKKEVLHLLELHQGPDHTATATALNNLATLLQATNRLAEAEPLMRRALKIDEASYGPDHPQVAIYINNLAQLLQDTNRLGEAEPLYRRALTIDEASYGPDHPDVARDLNNLATLFHATNRLGEAEPLMVRVVTILENKGGEPLPNYAASLNNLARLLQATNRLGEAEPLYRRALKIDEASYGPDHPNVARRLSNLATLFHATNRLGEAEPLMVRALKIDEASYGPDHPKVATDLNNLAQLLQATNRLGEAEPLMRRALKIDEASFGPDHPTVATALNNLAQLLQATNRLGEAELLMRRHLVIFLRFQVSTGHAHPHRDTAIGNYLGLLQEMGRTEGEILGKLREVVEEAGLQFEEK